MQVTLKQTEIEAALKGFITAQGISLNNKQVTVSFTAGRKESGISAEIEIDDLDIPEFGELENAGPVLVQTTPVIVPQVLKRAVAEEVEVDTTEDQEAVEEKEAPVTEAKTTSLFS